MKAEDYNVDKWEKRNSLPAAGMILISYEAILLYSKTAY
jgi:hypothetical protein